MIWLVALAGVLLVALDQWTKHWAFTVLRPVGERPILEGLLGFTYVENRGAAFGLFQGGKWLFIPLTLIIVGVVAYFYITLPKTAENWKLRIPMVLIVTGAVGNFIDRVRNGYVVDMFEFKFISFPVFNVADMCLVVGTFTLAFILLFLTKEKPEDAVEKGTDEQNL